MVTTIDFDFFQVIFKPYVFASNAAKCVNSHKTCSISLLSCLDLITISKPFLSPIGGPQEKRVKSRLLPFTAKPKRRQQRMKLEYKRMKLNTTNYCTYVLNFCVFCRLFYVLQLHHSDLFFFAHGLLYKSSKLSLDGLLLKKKSSILDLRRLLLC